MSDGCKHLTVRTRAAAQRPGCLMPQSRPVRSIAPINNPYFI